MISKRLTALVLSRDENVCQLNLPGCTYTATVADHRANRGMGGSEILDNTVNLIAACGLCNGLKETVSGALLDDLKRRGVRLSRAGTNAQTLSYASDSYVQYRGGNWYRLDTTGGRQIIKKVNQL
jgi:hypothetical protein